MPFFRSPLILSSIVVKQPPQFIRHLLGLVSSSTPSERPNNSFKPNPLRGSA